MFSQTVEYALRAVVHLADHAPASRTTQQIAIATHVPRPYLTKVLQGLTRAGLVQSRRGIGGGIALARQPVEVTILDVVNAVEPIARIEKCPLGLRTHGLQLCPLHQRLDSALAMVEAAFRQSTLAEMLSSSERPPPLCEVPKRKRLTVLD